MAIVGENGSGKSTVIQSAAAVYKSTAPKNFLKGRGFASDYFPNTAWDDIKEAEIQYSILEGEKRTIDTIRKPGERWRGNMERVDRPVVYIDLSRILPVAARVGYSKIAKTKHKEAQSQSFDKYRLERFNQIMGRTYEFAKMALTTIDAKRRVPVMGHQGVKYSGFHQGGGETTIAELIQADLPKYSLVLIDEVETSLHPRAQRRLLRDLADKCRESELQIVLTTHSPFILDELPLEARAQIIQTEAGRSIVYGVSPEFAMTKMDDVPQYECDVYVEDKRSQILLIEILIKHAKAELVLGCRFIPYGAASVGQALGIMVSQKRFPRPSCVFLDGDQTDSTGCIKLPGDEAPERVVFEDLRARNWQGIAARTGRNHADVVDACNRAMSLSSHRDWINTAATTLVMGGDILWQALSAEWAGNCLLPEEVKKIVQPIEDAKLGATTGYAGPVTLNVNTTPLDSSGNATLFEL
jgi:predicted ATPase